MTETMEQAVNRMLQLSELDKVVKDTGLNIHTLRKMKALKIGRPSHYMIQKLHNYYFPADREK